MILVKIDVGFRKKIARRGNIILSRNIQIL